MQQFFTDQLAPELRKRNKISCYFLSFYALFTFWSIDDRKKKNWYWCSVFRLLELLLSTGCNKIQSITTGSEIHILQDKVYLQIEHHALGWSWLLWRLFLVRHFQWHCPHWLMVINSVVFWSFAGVDFAGRQLYPVLLLSTQAQVLLRSGFKKLFLDSSLQNVLLIDGEE